MMNETLLKPAKEEAEELEDLLTNHWQSDPHGLINIPAATRPRKVIESWW